MPHPVQMLGLCRFSYLFGEQTGFAKPTALPGGGYDEARLEGRMRLFETLTLPGLAAQTDPDFTLVVLVGRGLPARFRLRLDDLARPHAQIVIAAEDEGQLHIDLCTALLRRHRDPRREIVGEFRMDDDDAVAVDFIARSRAQFDGLGGMVQGNRAVELDFIRGLALDFRGRRARAKEVVVPHWACAQVFFNRTTARRTAFQHHHRKSWHKHPCLSVSDQLMFVRSFHDTNDSGQDFDSLPGRFLGAGDAPTVAGRFGFDLAGVLGG